MTANLKSAKKSVKKAPKVKALRPCLCGCKGKTASRFVPGHDARLKGVLQKAYRSDKGLNATQKALVAELEWERFMEKPTGKIELNGLTLPQYNILGVLAKASGRGFTRPELKKRLTGASLAMTTHLGPIFREDVKKVEARTGVKSLLGKNMVTVRQEPDKNDRDVTYYAITAVGRKALKAVKVRKS